MPLATRAPGAYHQAMPTIYALKPAFQGLLRPVADVLVARRISPNTVTFAGIAVSLAGGACVALHPDARWPLLLLPVLLFARMALNALDGFIARAQHRETRLGAVLNEAGDIASDAAMYLPLALVPGVPAPYVLAFTALGALTELVRLHHNPTNYAGPMGKSDRAALVGVLALLLATGLIQAAAPLLGAGILLALLTVRNRA